MVQESIKHIPTDLGQNFQINLCNLLFLVFLCNFVILGLGHLFLIFLGAFNVF